MVKSVLSYALVGLQARCMCEVKVPDSKMSVRSPKSKSPQASDLPLLYWLGLVSGMGEGAVMFYNKKWI